MSLQSLILSLIGEIQDAAIRTDIASSIMFLRDLYMTGRISEAELKNELRDIVDTVISALYPGLMPEERKKKVEAMAGAMVKAIKLDTLKYRKFAKYPTLPPELGGTL